jgi:hypothetical protein
VNEGENDLGKPFMGCPLKGRGDMRKDVMVRDFEVFNDVFTRSDMVSGISITKKGPLSDIQDDGNNDNKDDFCDGRQKPEDF